MNVKASSCAAHENQAVATPPQPRHPPEHRLAKKPPECLEYIVVHELAHLIEPSHNARFVSVMNLSRRPSGSTIGMS